MRDWLSVAELGWLRRQEGDWLELELEKLNQWKQGLGRLVLRAGEGSSGLVVIY